ncbi:hypothetical protein [Devosia lacusdianchii]|uniref:hypothetical protein n=1 Tax=Devosia lacusdianchii TaxID=2917991 RepID=UPI001F06CB36|nr:hypothetical protein [Devosia sp. JXJ CY 41]
MIVASLLRPALALLVLATFACPTLAQEGEYSDGKDGELSAKISHIKDDLYAVAIDTFVLEGDVAGCIAFIEGETNLDATGGTLVVEDGGEHREISLSFDAAGALTITEQGGCFAFTGGQCSFDGQVMKVVAAN